MNTLPKNKNHPDFHVLITAAGTGERMGTDIPKQYIKIHGKTVLRHSIDAFYAHPSCKSIKVIIGSNDAGSYHEAVEGLSLEEYAIGEKIRNRSIYNGLKSYSNLKNEDIILIHDAARPCVSTSEINDILISLAENRAATLATPVSSTLRKSDSNQDTGDTVSRDDLWALQTPQAFRYGDIMKAHENADPEQNYTDDSALATAAGIPVKLVKGHESNIKITYKQDLIMAEKLLKPNAMTLTGLGYDVHAFDDAPGPVRLCGVDVPHSHKLKGHSDADVGLHAITDAILGAIGEGDIGQHFPPSDDTYKDIDSAIFLEKTLDIMRSKSASLNNIDITLICEEPKIGPHTPAMKSRIADITGLSESRINVKATTSEKLGFTGRKEGIAAQAIASLSIPQKD